MKSIQNLNILALIFVILSFVGFADASYLSAKFFLQTPIPCSIFEGCDTVTSSQYSHIGPVPVAILGVMYYLTLIILGIYYLDSRKKTVLKTAGYITSIGLIASIFFVYLQLFVIQAICLYCMISAIISLILFIIGQILISKIKKAELEEGV